MTRAPWTACSLPNRYVIHKIAALAGCSQTLVMRARREADITIRPPRRRSPSLSRHWLKHEYVTRGKSFKALAAESGISHTTLIRHAEKWGIPRRPRGSRPAT